MSLERDLIGRWHNGDLLPEEYMKLMKETKELLAQPEQDNTQYLLDQVSRLTAENAMLKEKWLAQPKHTSLELEVADCCGSEDYREGFKDGALYAEKMHGIVGKE